MKKFLAVILILGSANVFACELDREKQIDVDTWFVLFQTHQLNTPFGKSGEVKLSETGLRDFDAVTDLSYSITFHRALSDYGHKGIEIETIMALEKMKKKDATICELAKYLGELYIPSK